MENKQPILSICIPIYNRLSFLDRQLERMLEDKVLFEEEIHLLVSDNCSEDNLKLCCDNYQAKGLMLEYHRNVKNLGSDGNFDYCFTHAKGKYTWLLGSDDIPLPGVIKEILEILQSNDFGLLHIKSNFSEKHLYIYESPEKMLAKVSHWITFMSANIFKTENAKGVFLSNYKGSFLIQIPLYITACTSNKLNGYLQHNELFEPNRDVLSGYNLYQVFVINFLKIYEEYVEKGDISKQGFNHIKRELYKMFLAPLTVRYKLLKEETKLKTDNGWKILFNYYGKKPYAYFYMMVWYVWFIVKKLWKR